MAIVMLPAESDGKSDVYVQTWKRNPTENRFIPQSDLDGIKINMGSLLIDGKDPFESKTAFYAGKIYFEELEALMRFYRMNIRKFSGFTTKMVRLKTEDNEWEMGWALVAMDGNENLYDEAQDLILAYCSPFDRDIPPSGSWAEFYDKDDQVFLEALKNYMLIGERIAEKLSELKN